MGESFGPWKMGEDEAIMPYITSANVACGGHAGDPDIMRRTVRMAKQHGVSVGAHPGYPDLGAFGRRPFVMGREEVVNTLLYQISALAGIARAEGIELRHVKPHGALYNTACVDVELADAVAEAVAAFASTLVLVGLPGSELEAAAGRHNLAFASEGFADRAYEPNGLLRDRRYSDALLTDPNAAARQAVALAQGYATAHNGATLSLKVETLCIHGDTPGAPRIAEAVRAALEDAGFTVSGPVAAS